MNAATLDTYPAATHHVIRVPNGELKIIDFKPSQGSIFSGSYPQCEAFVEVETQRYEDAKRICRLVGSVGILFLAIWSTLYACGAL